MNDFQRVLLVKNEVFVYRIPPRQSNRGYRAADWKLDAPDWTGRMKVVEINNELLIMLEDKNDGNLFAKCPIDAHPGLAVESVLDSSRYFVIRLRDDNGRTAFIGIGFADRSDSFDMNVCIQDYFKQLKNEHIEQESLPLSEASPLDLGFKEGQTIKLNLSTKRAGDGKPKVNIGKPNQSTGHIGLIPPPPSSKNKNNIVSSADKKESGQEDFLFS